MTDVVDSWSCVRGAGASAFLSRLRTIHDTRTASSGDTAADFRALCGYSSSLSNACGDAAYAELCQRVLNVCDLPQCQREWISKHVRRGTSFLRVDECCGDDATFSVTTSTKVRRSRRGGFRLLAVCFLLLRPFLSFRDECAGGGPTTHAGLLRSVYDWHDRESVEHARLLHGALLHVGLCL